MKLSVTLALGALLVLPVLAVSPSASADTKEPSTGVMFKDSAQPAGATSSLSLVGVGVRTKTFLKVKVYAVGLYVDAAGAKTALAAHRGKSAGDLSKDRDVRSSMVSGEYTRSLRLVMARDVDGDDMAEAFADSVEPQVKKEGGAALRALETFKGYFKMDEVKEGTDLVFTVAPGGVFTTAIAGRKMGTITSTGFSKAFFNVFYGSGAVSPSLKTRTYKGIAALLAE